MSGVLPKACCCNLHPCCVTWFEYLICITGEEPTCGNETSTLKEDIPYEKSETKCFATENECREHYKDKEIQSVIFNVLLECEGETPPPEFKKECEIEEKKLCPIYDCGECGPYIIDCEVVPISEPCPPEISVEDCPGADCCDPINEFKCCYTLEANVCGIPIWWTQCRDAVNNACPPITNPLGSGTVYVSQTDLNCDWCDEGSSPCLVGKLWETFMPGGHPCLDIGSGFSKPNNWVPGGVRVIPGTNKLTGCWPSGIYTPDDCRPVVPGSTPCRKVCIDLATPEHLEEQSTSTCPGQFCCDGSTVADLWEGPGCYCLVGNDCNRGQVCPQGYLCSPTSGSNTESCWRKCCPEIPAGNGCNIQCTNVGATSCFCELSNPMGYIVTDGGCDCTFYVPNHPGAGAITSPLINNFTKGYMYDKNGNVMLDLKFITGYGEIFL